MTTDRGAVAYCVRADARRSWPSWLALGVLVGVAVGAVVAAPAGARRTDSAYRSLREETAAMDGAITFSCDPADDDTCPSSIEAIRAVPGIAEAGRFAITQTPIPADSTTPNVARVTPDAAG